MKPSEIVKGARYVGANGSIREVLRLLDSARVRGAGDSVEYRVITGRSAGKERIMRVVSFAHWAVQRAPDAESEDVAA